MNTFLGDFQTVCLGYIREWLYGIGPVTGPTQGFQETKSGYAPLYDSFESFYARNVYRRLKHSLHPVVVSVPGAKMKLADRVSDNEFWTCKLANEEAIPPKECINLGSYNYLGFAENSGEPTTEAIQAVRDHGIAYGSSRHELGTSEVHQKLEATVAEFVGTEDAITVGMGFATNTLNLPILMGKGCLVISDEFNHASLILGIRLSGATVAIFKHNNIEHMEKVLRNNIIKGHPRTRRPWKKIFIVVEGVYSMEGTIVNLPEVIALKKKYGAYLYLDEAHSVGAMGPRGRGVVDYYNLNPKDVDILMGTFTKSFGAAGGYIAGSKALIQMFRKKSQSFIYPTSMSAPVALQVIKSMELIMYSEEGLGRVKSLARNSKYFRKRLQQMGFIVYGHDDSPVIPMLLFMPAKVRAFVLECAKFNVATVTVGFPATKITEERVRFCMCAGHTKEMIDEALDVIDKVGDYMNIKYSSQKQFQGITIEY